MTDNMIKDNEEIKEQNNPEINTGTNIKEEGQMPDSSVQEQLVKKKLSPKVIGIISAAALSICIAGAVVAKAVVPMALPQVFVADALKTTQKVLLKEAKAIDDMTGRTLSAEIMQSAAMQTDFQLKFENMEGEGTEYINGIIRGIGVSGQMKKQKDIQNFLGNFAINQGSLELVRADFYKNGAEVGLAIPKLFEKYITVNLETLIQDYNSSALFDLIGEPINEEEYNTIKNYFETYQDQKVNPELIKNISKRSEEAFKKADIKYIGKTSAMTQDQSKTYRTYELILDESEVKSYLKDVFNMCMEDQALKDYIETLDAVQTPGYGEKLSDTLKRSREEFNKAIDDMKELGLKTTLKIDDNKRIIEANSEAVITIGEEKIEVALNTAFAGKKFMTDLIKVSLMMKNDEQQAEIEFASTSNYGAGENKLVHNMTFEVNEDQVVLANMKLDMTYDTKVKENNLVLQAEIKTADASAFSASVEGSMDINKASKQINMTMNKLALGVKDGYMDHAINFSGQYGIQAIKTTDIVFPQDNLNYLFDMTQNEIMALGEMIYTGMIQIGSVLLP